ncbi:hypothetical protein FNV43_RR23179 [Rhamnella rubrinervis]|uniref:Uncharacterized protein n=1 Tax=Rhamnella rubrinervis TaxID=2594499 RepID=A0A8K0E3A8_9ROSA|nr:hypothetical protein FNV43_RR23179 [Rhamnella rubrinervis]
MLLRSSSTPVLGSLLSETTPNTTPIHHEYSKPTTTTKLISFHQANTGSHHCLSPIVSCNSSPISPSIDRGFRRAQSDGNLQELTYTRPSTNINEDQFCDSYQPNKKYLTGRQSCLKLQTIPSFSLYNSRGYYEEEEQEEEGDIEDDEDIEELDVNEELLDRDLRRGSDAVMALENKVKNMNLTQVRDEEIWNLGFAEVNNELVNQQFYLAKGLGIGGSGGRGGGGDFYSAGSGGDHGEDKHGVEEYYKKTVEQNPGNPLFLRNYAQFLHQSKGDLRGAEEYYSRAILADPEDGEVLSQYAKLVWELHHSQDRAASYFERAVQASPEDSHVQAAYANFLWETEDEEAQDGDVMPLHLREGTMASATA